MEGFIDKWSISKEKVELIITDNAPNIVLAAQSTFGKDKHVPYFDHTLNLVPKAALGHKTINRDLVPNVPGVPELNKKVKAVIAFSHKSINFSDEFKRVQMQRGESEGTCLRLLQDVPTRWGSTFLMLCRLMKMADIISLVALKFPDVQMVSGSEMESRSSIKDILEPIHFATTEMGAEKHTTASKAIPMAYLIEKRINEVNIPASNALATAFKTFVKNELKRRFGALQSVIPHSAATLIDPRFLKITSLIQLPTAEPSLT
ncbi:zinc finger BED domain-containing protein 4-like [Belonocnema kinseyi]|uniref:zinc finger BED domain-containing protein 4-like n=1 Tax=Belonocnema kinseyi TaxID=2817044 RepID=UPI00143DD6A1|nr:zinc finger BED domain-containing protein 4-like [Belonocnema kinseyi]